MFYDTHYIQQIYKYVRRDPLPTDNIYADGDPKLMVPSIEWVVWVVNQSIGSQHQSIGVQSTGASGRSQLGRLSAANWGV